jgi:hypothetical protein
MVFIPVGRKYTSTIDAVATKSLTCEKCQTPYSYSFQASASGSGSSPLWLNNNGARHAAASKAREKLQDAVESTVLARACPTCGHYQSNMIDAYRRQRYKTFDFSFFQWFLIFLLYSFAIPMVGAILENIGVDRKLIGPFIVYSIVIFPVFAVCVRIGISVARKRIDPNVRR